MQYFCKNNVIHLVDTMRVGFTELIQHQHAVVGDAVLRFWKRDNAAPFLLQEYSRKIVVVPPLYDTKPGAQMVVSEFLPIQQNDTDHMDKVYHRNCFSVNEGWSHEY